MKSNGIYICHSGTAGRYVSMRMTEKLEGKGYSVYKAHGQDEVKSAIADCTDFVVILSNDISKDKSSAFAKEIDLAFVMMKNIVTVTMPDTDFASLPPFLRYYLARCQTQLAIADYFDEFITELTAALISKPEGKSTASDTDTNGTDVYEGSEPFIFVSYSHKDSTRVLPLIKGLRERGFRLWYDEGIEAGTEWPAYIEEHLEKCACVLVFLSDNSIDSVNCRNEINVAAELPREMLVAQLDENVTYKHGMRLQLSSRQKIFCSRHKNSESLLSELAKAKILEPCRDKERTASAHSPKHSSRLGSDPKPTQTEKITSEEPSAKAKTPTKKAKTEKSKSTKAGKLLTLVSFALLLIGTICFEFDQIAYMFLAGALLSTLSVIFLKGVLWKLLSVVLNALNALMMAVQFYAHYIIDEIMLSFALFVAALVLHIIVLITAFKRKNSK